MAEYLLQQLVYVVVVSVAPLLVSCQARDASFVVVDATSGHPLEGVKVVHQTHQVNMLDSAKPFLKELAPTNVNGRIELKKLDMNVGHSFRLTREGYHPAVLVISRKPPFWRPADILIASPMGSSVVKRNDILLKANRVQWPVTVRLHPTTKPGEPR